MARKSRRQTAAPMPAPSLYVHVALYIRLSVEDNKKRGCSVENQKLVLNDFLSDKPDFVVYDTYIDNGATGTNFHRPGFQQMLSDIEAGHINCVIVKDLSRLGRNSIDTGYYIEQYFHAHNVRFIAVTDQFDTADSGNLHGGIMLPLKNMINEAYALDIGRKIKAQARQAMKDGDYIGARAPYGYRKDPDNCHKLLIDENTAPVVGGLFGYVSITSSTEEYRNIENSYSTGQVNVTDATDATDSRNGTLVGCFSGNKIKNCYDTVTDALPMLGTTKYCQGVENCYSMSEDTSVTEPEGVVVKTKAEFASGEVAYLLDGTGENRAEAPVWGQNIGTDESPVLGGAAVYKDGDVYANTEHTYDVAYTWSADKKNCTAKQNCRLCGIEGAKETVAAAYSIKKQATEQAEGIGLYTAVFKNGLFTTQTAEVKIAKLTPKPSQPTNPSNPSNPTKPSDPSKPTNPSNPTKPTNNKKKPAAKGTTLKDSKGATYKVTGAKVKNPTITYVKPKKNVKKVNIPATITVKGIKYQVTAVSKDAFKNNKKVTQVTIDKNVNNIGKNAFYGCKNLKKVIIKTTKLTKKTVGKNAFKGIHKKATIKVPKKKLDVYKKLLKNAGISKSVKVVKM